MAISPVLSPVLPLSTPRVSSEAVVVPVKPDVFSQAAQGAGWGAFQGSTGSDRLEGVSGSALNAATLAQLAVPQTALVVEGAEKRTTEQEIILAELGPDALKDWNGQSDWQHADLLATAVLQRILNAGPPSDQEIARAAGQGRLVYRALGSEMELAMWHMTPEVQAGVVREAAIQSVSAARPYSPKWDAVAAATYGAAAPTTDAEHAEAHVKWRNAFEAALGVGEGDKLEFRMAPALRREFRSLPPEEQQKIADAVLSTSDAEAQWSLASLGPEDQERVRAIASWVKATRPPDSAPPVSRGWYGVPSQQPSDWSVFVRPAEGATEEAELYRKATEAMEGLMKGGSPIEWIELNGWAERFNLRPSPEAQPAKTNPLDEETRSIVSSASRNPAWADMGPAERAIALHVASLERGAWEALDVTGLRETVK